MTLGWPISLRDVSLRLDKRMVLVDLNAQLEQGCTVILGPNGAGKTALLRLLHGLQKPSQGTLQWGKHSTPINCQQAYVPSKARPFRRSVLENILLALKLNNCRGKDAVRTAHQALELCQLQHLADHPAQKLSSGETQKLFLARASALGAQTLLLDEPTANLDPASTKSIEGLISNLHQNGVQIILVTHQIAQARRLADHIIFLDQGRLCEQTSATSFFAKPCSLAGQTYLAEQ